MACFGVRGKGVARKMAKRLRGVPRAKIEQQLRDQLDESWGTAVLARHGEVKIAPGLPAYWKDR